LAQPHDSALHELTSDEPNAELLGVRAPPMATRRVSLRPLREEDYRFLYDIAVSDDVGFRWRFRGYIPTFPVFMDTLFTDVLCQFVVEDLTQDERIGVVVAYHPDLRNRYVYLGAALRSADIGAGRGVEACALLCNYLMLNWDLRKIYFETVEFSYVMFRSGRSSLFEEEAVLRDHIYYQGRYWNQYILSLTKEVWQTRIRALVDRL